MTRLKRFLQTWRRTLVALVMLSALALTVRFWLPFLLQLFPFLRQWMKNNAEELQGWSSAVQGVIWIAAGLVFMLKLLRPARPATSSTLAAGRPNIVVADSATIEKLLGAVADNPQLDADAKQYLTFLVDRYRYLDFRGMGVNDRLPLRMELLDLYVPLKARIELPEGETWARHLKVAGRLLSENEIETTGQRLSEPQPLAKLLQENAGLIILGDPGAGKTTFMKFLALNAALGQSAELGIGERMPFLLPLSVYATALAQGDTPLDQCLVDYWRKLCGDLPVAALLKRALSEGKALLLLDGLDEVREPGVRLRVVDRVKNFFLLNKANGNKFILTSRIVGYKEVRPAADGLIECTLVDFEAEEIERFVQQWTGAIEKTAHGTAALAQYEAERERQELLEAVERNPGVRQLAANPLLLTILAMMKRQGVELPERRAELYQNYVMTLLKHWNLARSLDRRPTRDLDEKETIKLLAPLALWMQEVSPGRGLVDEGDLRRKLIQLCQQRSLPDPEAAADRFLGDVHDHSALLLERGQRQYGFIHLTFQEYLAAVAVAQAGQLDRKAVVQTLAAHIDDGDWHEVSLLTIGYLGLVQQNDEVASAVLDDLLQLAPGAPGQAVLLAGECIADAWPGVTPACRQGVIEQLKTTLSQRQVNTQHRVACGRVLAHHNLGDPRSEITTIESMPFCYVPAGPFHMGSVDDEQAPANEKPQHLYDLTYPYWISRFPVSNAQFERFVAAGGYDNPSYWSEAQQHELWRAGQVRNVWYILNEKTELVVHHLGDWRRRYASIPEPFNLPNHPAIFLNWYEALAFSHWLEETLHAQGWLAVDWRVTLPSEPEWEKAARGGVQIVRRALQRSANNLSFPEKVAMIPNEMEHRRYPWGDNVDTEHMNYVESQIGSSSALGCYPAGASPYGVEELSGNVWEWTRSLWRTKADKPDFGYPYDAGDGRENLAAGDDTLRVLRGGSYNDDAAGVRCALRFGFNPFNRYVVIGFRVALSPSSSDF